MQLVLEALPEFQTTRWLGLDWTTIAVLGFAGQALFFLRFFIQWIASEKKGESVVPVSFWYVSILGTIFNLVYFTLRRDPVGVAGYVFNTAIYVRNLQLVQRKRARDQAQTAAPVTPPRS